MRKVELTDPDDIKYAPIANLIGITLDEPITEGVYRDMLDVGGKFAWQIWSNTMATILW